ncbi:TetR/AcrR family transcriptional regulator [Demequina salsinemoris]|uniref:TetR/AcrR family transcriptional regulator n=1 Tax=Demequina salsinemoris TaxID=577470 RepID=UPI000780CECA|nr:TetR/AcrR family transcriptional regulator [Demequina salsinemoris]
MPRIEAATVAEHHALRRAALLEAGRSLLASEGPDAVTPGAVGKAAGIARSSVYQYFPSTASLVAAIIEDAFERANAEILAAIGRADSPSDRLDAYLRASLDLASGSSHRMFDAIDPATLPPETLERIDALHREQMEPLATAVRDGGAADPEIAMTLIGGMLGAAAKAIQAGADPSSTADALVSAVHTGPVPGR